jgi:hypothetical protein
MANRTHLQIDPGLELISEDYVVKQMGNCMTTRGFRDMCRALGLPMIFFGSTAFVNQGELALCFQAISRLGEPDFYMPGARRDQGGSHERRTTLCQERYRRHWRRFVLELTAARKRNLLGRGLQKNNRQLKECGNRIAQASLHLLPLSAQRQRTRLQDKEDASGTPA